MKDAPAGKLSAKKIATRLFHAVVVIALLSSFTIVLATVGAALGVLSVTNGSIQLEQLAQAMALASQNTLTGQLLFCVVCALLIWRRLRYAIILPAMILCWSAIAYLGYDLPQRPSMPDIGPVTSPNAKSYKLFCWMVKDSPLSRLSELYEQKTGPDAFISQPPERCRNWLISNRERILFTWDKDVVGREWIAALSHEPDSGVILSEFDGPTLGFQATRAIFDHQLAYAAWLASENRGDEAAQVLVPLLRAANALQRSAAGPIPANIAGVFLKVCYKTSHFVVDSSTPGPTAKKELLKVLIETPPIGTTIRNCVVGDFASIRAALERGLRSPRLLISENTRTAGGLPRLAEYFGNRIVNPNLTEQTLKDFLQQCSELAQKRQFESLRTFIDDFQHRQCAWYRIKNSAGNATLASIVDPGVTKAYENLWGNEDARLALLKRLETEPASSVSP